MAKTKTEKVDWAAKISEEMLHYIDTNNTLPWMKGWVTDGIFPSNPVSGTEYRGINSMLLGLYQQARGYSTPYFCTFRQMVAAGGSFIGDAKGQGLPVVYWNRIVREDDKTGEKKAFGFWKGYTVFSLDLMEGIATPRSDRPVITISDAVAGLESATSVARRSGGSSQHRRTTRRAQTRSLSRSVSSFSRRPLTPKH